MSNHADVGGVDGIHVGRQLVGRCDVRAECVAREVSQATFVEVLPRVDILPDVEYALAAEMESLDHSIPIPLVRVPLFATFMPGGSIAEQDASKVRRQRSP